MMRRSTLLVAMAAMVTRTVDAGSVDPRHAANITVYHVNKKTYGVEPRNMNTANINGDIYFDLRTRGFPLECGIWRNTSFWSRLDCVNTEVVDPSELAITKLILEVDTRFGLYADCNADPDTGAYTCFCEGVAANCSAMNNPAGQHECDNSDGCYWTDGGCYSYGCPNITDQRECTQGYHKCDWNNASETCHDPPGPPLVCNGSEVGYLNLSTVQWGRQTYGHGSMSTVDYWHGNTLAKTRGFWYSTWAEGECHPSDPSQGFCSWRVVEEVKKIAKTCSDASINNVIIQGDKSASWGGRCFDACSPADRANTSSTCFIMCFYKNVLGPYGSSKLMNDTSPDFGIPVPDLIKAWDKPFLPESEGGCPAIPTAPPTSPTQSTSPVSAAVPSGGYSMSSIKAQERVRHTVA
eukprot:m.84723 g.84723  ORF g.84723 m.84723 type:complete len:408 (-) comp9606_c0_seq1:490-1713(-)